MENKGLLFIPDISGFTRFVNETEIEHSRLIIQELLELLINANQIGCIGAMAPKRNTMNCATS